MSSPNSLIAAFGAVAFVVLLGGHVLRPSSRVPWWLPAVVSLAFLGFTSYAAVTEGPLGFWTEHVRRAWGNQIWLDLLFSASVGWTALLPRARSVGMWPWAWALVLPLGGSIALLAMLARVLYLEGHPSTAPDDSGDVVHRLRTY